MVKSESLIAFQNSNCICNGLTTNQFIINSTTIYVGEATGNINNLSLWSPITAINPSSNYYLVNAVAWSENNLSPNLQSVTIPDGTAEQDGFIMYITNNIECKSYTPIPIKGNFFMTAISNLFPSPYQVPRYTNYGQGDEMVIAPYQWEVTNNRGEHCSGKTTDGPIYLYNNTANCKNIIDYAFSRRFNAIST